MIWTTRLTMPMSTIVYANSASYVTIGSPPSVFSNSGEQKKYLPSVHRGKEGVPPAVVTCLAVLSYQRSREPSSASRRREETAGRTATRCALSLFVYIRQPHTQLFFIPARAAGR